MEPDGTLHHEQREHRAQSVPTSSAQTSHILVVRRARLLVTYQGHILLFRDRFLLLLGRFDGRGYQNVVEVFSLGRFSCDFLAAYSHCRHCRPIAIRHPLIPPTNRMVALPPIKTAYRKTCRRRRFEPNASSHVRYLLRRLNLIRNCVRPNEKVNLLRKGVD